MDRERSSHILSHLLVLGWVILLSNGVAMNFTSADKEERLEHIEGQASESRDPSREEKGPNTEIATLGGGCFWCLEAVFDELNGVKYIESGYAGGTVADPSYRQVCTGTTGHAEVVHITFDPTVISFQELLEAFFTIHDPTTLNRQGADVGTQYRSVIFYHTQEQRAIAEQMIEELNAAHLWDGPIVTEITPFTAFYRAEDYHQEYYRQNGEQPYCRVVIAPKLAKFRKRYRAKLKGR